MQKVKHTVRQKGQVLNREREAKKKGRAKDREIDWTLNVRRYFFLFFLILSLPVPSLSVYFCI